MDWIMRSTDEVFSLADEQRVAGLLAQLAERIARGEPIAGISDLVDLLTGIDRNSEVRRALIKHLAQRATEDRGGLTPEQAVADLLLLIRSPQMQRHLPELRLLTCRWDQIGAAGSRMEPRIYWHGLDRFKRTDAAVAALRPLRLNFAASADRALVCEPVTAADLPAELDEALRARLPLALQLSLAGHLEADAALQIPIRFGSLGLSGESSAAARLSFYVDRADDTHVAQSFAAAFGALANPFDLQALASAFDSGRLRAVRLEAGGAIGLGGSLNIGVRERIFAGAIPRIADLDAQLGVALGFHTACRGEYLINLYPAVPTPPRGRALRVDIHRRRGQERSLSAVVGLTLDLTPVLKELRTDLLDHAGRAGALLRRLDAFIPPSLAIEKTLDERLAANATAEHRAMLAEVFGASAETPATARLGQRLAEVVDRGADIWRGHIDAVAAAAVSTLIDQLSLTRQQEQLLVPLARGVVAAGLTQSRTDLRQRIARDLHDRDAIKDLSSALRGIGEPMEVSAASLDAITERAAGELDRLQGIIAKLTAALRETSEFKLNARWRSEERRSRGSSVQQSLLFRPWIAGADALFQRALTGSLDDVFHEVAGGDADDTNRPVSLIAGALQAFAGVHRESGLELALLDFSLQGTSILDADVTVETDSAGNISVRSRSTSRRTRSRLAAYDQFEIVNAFALVAARATRRMTFSLALSHVEDDLAVGEARKFFEGFVAPELALLTQAQVEAGIAALLDARRSRKGELRAWIELNGPALLGLLRLELGASGAAPPLSREQRRIIYEASMDALLAGLRLTGDRAKWNNLTDLVRSGLRRRDINAVMKETFSNQNLLANLRPESETTDPSGAAAYKTVTDLIERAKALIDAIEQMRAVYLSSGGWSVDDYLERQERIGEKLAGWLKGEFLAQGIGGLMSSTAGPYALAFFKAVADLADVDRGRRSPLLASIVIEQNGHELQVPLIVPEATPASALTPATSIPARLLGPVTAAGSGHAAASDTAPPPAAEQSPAAGSTASAGAPPVAETSPGTANANRIAQPTTTTSGRQQTASTPMADQPFIYPLDDKQRTRTYHSGGRQFNADRDRGSRRHAACDMLADKGTAIRAMADGRIRRGPAKFYSGTYALEVVHDRLTGALAGRSMIVRYGEILQRTPNGIGPGKRVQQGDVIAYVGRLNSGSSMLHLEMYEQGDNKDPLTVLGNNKWSRRSDLVDPTSYLDEAPTWAEFQKGGKEANEPPKEPPATAKAENTIDATKTSNAINCRAKPSVDPAVPPLYTLRPGESFHVLRLVTGGRHPYGTGDLWAEVSYPGRGIGYVIAHFVKMKGVDPVHSPSQHVNLGDQGVVDIDGDTLNLRKSAGMNGEVVATLKRGEHVTIISDEEYIAATDMPTRNVWFRVKAGAHEGFVAAHYIDISGSAEPGKTDDPQDPVDLDPWIKTLIGTDWPGCLERTARQINSSQGGPEVSRRMAEQDLPRVLAMASVFQDVAAKFAIPAAILAGIASRETHCGGYLPGGWSDNGEDFGIMQINRHSHPELDTTDPRGVRHVEQAAGILAGYLRQISAKWSRQGWEPRYLLQGAVAAYNFGPDNVRTKERIDIGTTNDDYAGDALTRAAWYYHEPRLKTFFQ